MSETPKTLLTLSTWRSRRLRLEAGPRRCRRISASRDRAEKARGEAGRDADAVPSLRRCRNTLRNRRSDFQGPWTRWSAVRIPEVAGRNESRQILSIKVESRWTRSVKVCRTFLERNLFRTVSLVCGDRICFFFLGSVWRFGRLLKFLLKDIPGYFFSYFELHFFRRFRYFVFKFSNIKGIVIWCSDIFLRVNLTLNQYHYHFYFSNLSWTLTKFFWLGKGHYYEFHNVEIQKEHRKNCNQSLHRKSPLKWSLRRKSKHEKLPMAFFPYEIRLKKCHR